MKKCRVCANEIKISIFKGEDWCSENCRKELELYPRITADRIQVTKITTGNITWSNPSQNGVNK
jgi:predicted nucleic acid-binding Zn ribbon protein